MAVDNLPQIRATRDDRTLTLGELRELVEAAALLPADCILRGNTVPFRLADLGNVKGGSLMTLAIDKPTP